MTSRNVNLVCYLCSPFSVPQCGEENHQDDDELENLNLIEESNAVMIFEVFDSLLQVVVHFRELLHSANALHENPILGKYLRMSHERKVEQAN